MPFKSKLKRLAEVDMPTEWGAFRMIAYAQQISEKMPHLAYVTKDLNVDEPVLVRLHSECMTGDVFHSLRCDCGQQLSYAMEEIAKNKNGVLIYLRQEGRGIGLINKMKAYQWQDKGMDTVQANVHLGFEPDQRDYHDAATILSDLKIKEINLMTNNPHKIKEIKELGFEVKSRVPILITPNNINEFYMNTKHEKMGHLH